LFAILIRKNLKYINILCLSALEALITCIIIYLYFKLNTIDNLGKNAMLIYIIEIIILMIISIEWIARPRTGKEFVTYFVLILTISLAVTGMLATIYALTDKKNLNMIYSSIITFVIVVFVMLIMSRTYGFIEHTRNTIEIILTFGEKEYKILTLIDTGNMLKCPLDNSPVIVLSAHYKRAVEANDNFIIECHTATGCKTLQAQYADCLEANYKNKAYHLEKIAVAFSEELSFYSGIHAIASPNIFK
jgi:hypothetical protein